jgi:hypothetical protein
MLLLLPLVDSAQWKLSSDVTLVSPCILKLSLNYSDVTHIALVECTLHSAHSLSYPEVTPVAPGILNTPSPILMLLLLPLEDWTPPLLSWCYSCCPVRLNTPSPILMLLLLPLVDWTLPLLSWCYFVASARLNTPSPILMLLLLPLVDWTLPLLSWCYSCCLCKTEHCARFTVELAARELRNSIQNGYILWIGIKVNMYTVVSGYRALQGYATLQL